MGNHHGLIGFFWVNHHKSSKHGPSIPVRKLVFITRGYNSSGDPWLPGGLHPRHHGSEISNASARLQGHRWGLQKSFVDVMGFYICIYIYINNTNIQQIYAYIYICHIYKNNIIVNYVYIYIYVHSS